MHAKRREKELIEKIRSLPTDQVVEVEDSSTSCGFARQERGCNGP